MKKIISILVLSVALMGTAFAHCGKCGMEGEHKAAEGAAGSAQCAMHAEKTATLQEAATALEASKPELAVKLKDIAAKCCAGEHAKA